MDFKSNLLQEVKQAIKAAANKPVLSSNVKGNSIRRSSLLGEAHITHTDFLRSAGHLSRWLLSGSEQAKRILITQPRPASSLKHVNIKRG